MFAIADYYGTQAWSWFAMAFVPMVLLTPMRSRSRSRSRWAFVLLVDWNMEHRAWNVDCGTLNVERGKLSFVSKREKYETLPPGMIQCDPIL